VRIERLREDVTHTRDRLLDVIRGRAFSTFSLLPAGEYERGARRAEAELPAEVRSATRMLFAVAER
jgi:hypothetical protein